MHYYKHHIGDFIKDTANLEKSSVSGRRNALIAASLVEYAPERKCRITGRFVQAVRVPGGAN